MFPQFHFRPLQSNELTALEKLPQSLDRHMHLYPKAKVSLTHINLDSSHNGLRLSGKGRSPRDGNGPRDMVVKESRLLMFSS